MQRSDSVQDPYQNVQTKFTERTNSEFMNHFEVVIEYVRKFDDNTESVGLEIANICAEEINAGPQTIKASIIYGALYDKDIDIKSIKEYFDEEIAGIIKGLKAIPEMNIDKIKLQTENHIKLLLSIAKDVRAILIKMAERLYVARNISKFSIDEQKLIIQELEYLYIPVAHRIGLYYIKQEFEDFYLKYTNYGVYKNIANQLNQTKPERDNFINDFISPIADKLQANGIDCEIKGRPKSISSIWNKMQKQEVKLTGIYDLFAIRIIIDAKNENEKALCWKAYSLVTEEFTPDPYRLRDWISSPKSSGYESLHTTVKGPGDHWVEIQIRTKRMDFKAEKGLAAHWMYKNNGNSKSGSSFFAQIRNALEKADQLKSLSKSKKRVESDEIFVFTPQGDLKRLKKGDTVLDFAFLIHTNLGQKCFGANVNDKFVSIKHQLKNGDSVKIITNNTVKPSNEWIKIANNSRVKNKIKRILKSIEYKWSESGKEILKQKFDQLNFEFNDINVIKVTRYLDLKQPIELFQQLGEGKIDILKIKKALTDEEKENNKAVENVIENKKEEKSKIRKDFLVIDNLNTIHYTFAKCCSPIPGDKIFAFVTVMKGTKIHRYNCPNAKQIREKYPYRIIEAVWRDDIQANVFVARIKVEGKNALGMGNTITNIISNEFKLEMRSLNITEKSNGSFQAEIIVNVQSTKQLDGLITRFVKTKEIYKAQRVTNV